MLLDLFFLHFFGHVTSLSFSGTSNCFKRFLSRCPPRLSLGLEEKGE